MDPNPLINYDGDEDGLPDDWEIYYGVEEPSLDVDADTLTNEQEFLINTNPNDPDTDDDKVQDGFDARPNDNSEYIED